MANDLGLFSPEFYARNADVLESINTGPSPAEVRASGAALGLTGAAATPSTTPGPFFEPDKTPDRFGLDDVGRYAKNTAKALFAPFTVPAHMGMVRDAPRQELIKAQARLQNLTAASTALDLMSGFARNVASISDPDQRRAVTLQAAETVARDFGPSLVPLFGSLVENQAAANIDRKEQLAKFIQYSPTAARIAAINNGDFSDISDGQMETIVSEVNRGVARDSLKSIKPFLRRLFGEYERRFKSEAAKQEESDKTLTVSEAQERIGMLADEYQELQDPSFSAAVNAVLSEFPESVGVRRDEDVAESRKNLKVVLGPDGVARYVPRDESIYGEAPASGTTINIGGAAGSKDLIYGQVLDETGSPRIAAAVVEGKAYRDPVFGEYLFGNRVDKEKSEGSKGFFTALNALEESAEDVVRAYPNTDILTEAVNKGEALLGPADPTIQRYEQARIRATAQLVRALQGGRPSDKDMEIFSRMFPTVRSLAENNALSEDAASRFEGLREQAFEEYAAKFPVEEQPRIVAALRSVYGSKLGVEAVADDVDKSLTKLKLEMTRDLNREPTPDELAERWERVNGR